MIKQGKIIAVDGNKATVEEYEKSLCDTCPKKNKAGACDTCPHKRETDPERVVALNNAHAEVGDIVEYSKSNLAIVLSTLIAVIVPIICYVLSHFIFGLIIENVSTVAKLSLAVLIIGMIAAAVYSYFSSKRRCDHTVMSVIEDNGI